MTLPSESLRALSITRDFLRSLLDPKATPRVPRKVRDAAGRCLRHYPWQMHLERRWADDVCEHGNDRRWCGECKAACRLMADQDDRQSDQ